MRIVSASIIGLSASAAVLVACLAVGARQEVRPPTERYTSAHGWPVPRADTADPSAFQGKIPIAGTEFYVEFLEVTPSSEVIYQLPTFDQIADPTAGATERHTRISKVIEFSFYGKPYYYGLLLVFAHYDPETGRGGTAGQVQVCLYDEDGDGRFEVMESLPSQDWYRPRLPEWARAER